MKKQPWQVLILEAFVAIPLVFIAMLYARNNPLFYFLVFIYLLVALVTLYRGQRVGLLLFYAIPACFAYMAYSAEGTVFLLFFIVLCVGTITLPTTLWRHPYFSA